MTTADYLAPYRSTKALNPNQRHRMGYVSRLIGLLASCREGETFPEWLAEPLIAGLALALGAPSITTDRVADRINVAHALSGCIALTGEILDDPTDDGDGALWILEDIMHDLRIPTAGI